MIHRNAMVLVISKSENHLSVNDQVDAVEKDAHEIDDNLEHWDFYNHPNDHHWEHGKIDHECKTSKHAEVNLGLISVNGQSDGYQCSTESSLNDNHILISCGDTSNHDWFSDSENSEQNQIGWVWSSKAAQNGTHWYQRDYDCRNLQHESILRIHLGLSFFIHLDKTDDGCCKW